VSVTEPAQVGNPELLLHLIPAGVARIGATDFSRYLIKKNKGTQMNAPRRIRTVVVEVAADNDWLANGGSRPRFKPSDLVPWSDPYIAGLVRKLQDEVRDSSRVDAEAEMPWNEPFEYESEETGFSIDLDALLKG
jgi:hypothetical protein